MAEPTFLALPGEIRNQIYQFLLLVHISPSVKQERGSTPPIHPQILAVCKQTHREASGILYGHNIYISNDSLLTSMPRLRAWYRPVTAARYIRMIKRYHMHVRLDCDARFTAESARTSFSKLDELTIEVFQSQFGSSDHEVMKLFEGIRGLKKVRIFGSIRGFPEYAKWLEDIMICPADVAVAELPTPISNSVRIYDLWIVSE